MVGLVIHIQPVPRENRNSYIASTVLEYSRGGLNPLESICLGSGVLSNSTN